MIGLAKQLAPKSAANNVILFGLYWFSRSTHGNMTDGTFGVKEKIAGSQILNTPSRIAVVIMISDIKARAYPKVKDTWNVPIYRLLETRWKITSETSLVAVGLKK